MAATAAAARLWLVARPAQHERTAMYSDVIIGFDGSAPARDALALGRRLASAAGARLAIVYVHPYMALSSDPVAEAAVELSWRAGAERTLDEARQALSDVPDVRFRAMADSSPARALHRAAEECDAALIVLGSTHRGKLGRVLPGTTADQVVHAAPCAVAVAPAGYAARESLRSGVVGAAVDGGDETERVARVAAHIAGGAGSVLRLVTVVETHDPQGRIWAGAFGHGALRDAMRQAATSALERAAVAAGNGEEVERRAREGTAADELMAESNDLDLLVMGSRGFGPLRRVVLGSVAGKVLRAAACPVLVLPRGPAEQLDDSVVRLSDAAAR